MCLEERQEYVFWNNSLKGHINESICTKSKRYCTLFCTQLSFYTQTEPLGFPYIKYYGLWLAPQKAKSGFGSPCFCSAWKPPKKMCKICKWIWRNGRLVLIQMMLNIYWQMCKLRKEAVHIIRMNMFWFKDLFQDSWETTTVLYKSCFGLVTTNYIPHKKNTVRKFYHLFILPLQTPPKNFVAICSWVMLLPNKQTDRQTNATENMSLLEIIKNKEEKNTTVTIAKRVWTWGKKERSVVHTPIAPNV